MVASAAPETVPDTLSPTLRRALPASSRAVPSVRGSTTDLAVSVAADAALPTDATAPPAAAPTVASTEPSRGIPSSRPRSYPAVSEPSADFARSDTAARRRPVFITGSLPSSATVSRSTSTLGTPSDNPPGRQRPP